MRALLCLLLLGNAALANTCLSSGTGNWNDSSKWSNCGGGVPVDGDTAKIANGHTITIPAGYNAVVGLSAAGNTQAAATANTTLNGALTTGSTTIVVTSGTGISIGQSLMLPYETTNTTEIVLVTAGSGTSWTITRAQNGTAASAHATGAAVYGGSIPAISCNGNTNYGGNGTGILAVNGTLTFRGNVEQCSGAVWTVGPDAILEHDSSAAASPSTTHYKFIIGANIFPDAAKLVIRGTSGHRALIRNATSSGTFYGFSFYYGAAQGSGQFDFEYTSIDGCGSATTNCTDASTHNATTAFLARCDHCLVTASGNMNISTSGGAVNVVRITNSSFTTPVDTTNKYVFKISVNTGSDIVVDTVYTTGVIFLTATNNTNAYGTHVRNVFLVGNNANTNPPITLGGANFRVGEFDRVVRITDNTAATAATGTPAYLPGGTITRIMCLMNSNSNPHCFNGPVGDGTSSDIIDGAYSEKLGTGIDGDLFLGAAKGPIDTIKNVVVTCSTTDGKSIGTFINVTVSTTAVYVMDQNTICGKDGGASTGMGASLETWAGAAGLFRAIKNNITFAATASSTVYLVRQGPSLGGPGDPTAGTYNGADYNWVWNATTGPYYGINADYTSPSPPGTHDTVADPQFVSMRHFLDWGQLLKPSIATWADITAEFAKMNDDSGFDERFTILNAYNWLREGYRPQNAAVMTAGDTGGRVGAMDVVATPPVSLIGPSKMLGPSTTK